MDRKVRSSLLNSFHGSLCLFVIYVALLYFSNEPVDQLNTCEASVQQLIKVGKGFSLNHSKIIIVSDKGSNVQKA